jgi:hypothetical protein
MGKVQSLLKSMVNLSVVADLRDIILLSGRTKRIYQLRHLIDLALILLPLAFVGFISMSAGIKITGLILDFQ